MPRVSVITAVFNNEETLSASIESVLTQSFSDFEFIIINDGSSDASAEILGKIRDPRIIFLSSEKNLGLSTSINQALQIAKGEFIARHDADDTSTQNRLELQVKYLDEHPEIGVLGGQMEIVDGKGRSAGQYQLPTSHGMLAWLLFFDRTFAHPTVMMRKELLIQANGYDEKLRFSQDHELWTRLVGNTRFANLPNVLVSYRSISGGPGFLKTQEQFTNRMHSRHKLAIELLGREIPFTFIRWMDASQKKPCSLSEAQKMEVTGLVVGLFEALKNKKIILPQDESEMYSDYQHRLIAVKECNENATTTHSGRTLRGLRWAITNPFKAIKKLFKLMPGINKKSRTTFGPQIVRTGHGLSIVVLTHKRMKGLETLLKSLAEQQFRHGKLELIVFNNSPGNWVSSAWEPLSNLAGRFSDLKVINSSYNWGTSARYGMATMSSYESILMLDDDLYLKDANFLSNMLEAFRSLSELDILSCWNELWISWDSTELRTVSLDFLTPGINEIIPTDTIGPGVAMFNRKLILHPQVMDAAMQRNQAQPIVSDMGFPLVASQVHGSHCYYFPAWDQLAFHEQAHQEAIYQIPKRHQDLLSAFKRMYQSGYKPVLSRLEELAPFEGERVRWAIDTLPAKSYSW